MDIIALFCDIEQFLLIPKNRKNKWVKEAIRQVRTYTSFFGQDLRKFGFHDEIDYLEHKNAHFNHQLGFPLNIVSEAS